MNNKIKTITIVIALIIILGIIITLTAGLNIDMMTRSHKQVQLNIGKEIDLNDIKTITGEVFEGQTVENQKVEVYGEDVLISTSEITEEQKNNLVTKINEKYETELKSEEITISSVPRMHIKDYITPHILEFVIVTIIIALYTVIRYKKLGFLKVLVQTILGIVIIELLVFSMVAICRVPVGSNIVSIMFVTYAIAVLGLATMFENKYKKLKLEEENNKK